MKKLLHVGCGLDTQAELQGFESPAEWEEIRLDIDPNNQPDVLGTITDLGEVADASVDAVYSAHNIEHVHTFEVPGALKEFLRVLSPDGFAVITCPDMQSVCELVAQDQLYDTLYVSPGGPIRPIDIIYGHQASIQGGNTFMAHKSGFTSKTLGQALHAAGFGAILIGRAPYALWALASKGAREKTEMMGLAQSHFPSSG